jgi:hypothetical protein
MHIALEVSTGSARAQSLPSPNTRDQVTVNLPQRVTVGTRVLQPGEYRIRQVSDTQVEVTGTAPGSDSARVAVAVTVIVTTFNDPSPQTQVTLHRFGDDYYFDKMWLQGKGYGYLFTLPEGIQARERELRPSVTLTGRFEQVAAGVR